MLQGLCLPDGLWLWWGHLVVLVVITTLIQILLVETRERTVAEVASFSSKMNLVSFVDARCLGICNCWVTDIDQQPDPPSIDLWWSHCGLRQFIFFLLWTIKYESLHTLHAIFPSHSPKDLMYSMSTSGDINIVVYYLNTVHMKTNALCRNGTHKEILFVLL